MLHRAAGPADGPYLHAWPYEYGLEGEGFAPLSTPTHHLMTRAALDALPEARAWLGGEAELLTWCYCGLQDMNWPTYGRFNNDGPFRKVRFPDSRREWEISRYCRYNHLMRKRRRLHDGPEAAAILYQRAVSAGKRGRSWDAARLLGIALHAFQDSGSPMHAAYITSTAIHGPGEMPRDHSALDRIRHRPGPDFDPRAATESLTKFAIPRGRKIARLLEADIETDVLDLQMECAKECVKVTIDALADFHRRFGDRLRFQARPPRKNVNLLKNPDFAQPDDEDSCPRGWVMKWWDRADRKVHIGREKTRKGWTVTARKVRRRVACLTAWPKAIRVRPGQVFRLAASVLSPGAGTCGLYAEAYADTTRKLADWKVFADGSRRWRRQETEIRIPDNCSILRVGVFAERTLGPARFTDAALVRIA